MNDFSLSRSREKVLPESLRASDGRLVMINPDFRTVLKCIRVLDDPDVSDRDKLYLLMRWFFRGDLVPDAYTLFAEFVSGDSEPDGEPPVMDFEQDADALYSSFMMDYGIDLLDIPFLHWAKFRALMGGLSEKSAMCQRIAIRKMDTSGMKGKARADAERAKRRVRLKRNMGSAERALQAEIDKALSEGKNPVEAIEKLKRLYGDDEA